VRDLEKVFQEEDEIEAKQKVERSKEKLFEDTLDAIRVKWGEVDWKIVCQECGVVFIFTKGEQDFYKKQNFNSPRRCLGCKA